MSVAIFEVTVPSADNQIQRPDSVSFLHKLVAHNAFPFGESPETILGRNHTIEQTNRTTQITWWAASGELDHLEAVLSEGLALEGKGFDLAHLPIGGVFDASILLGMPSAKGVERRERGIAKFYPGWGLVEDKIQRQLGLIQKSRRIAADNGIISFDLSKVTVSSDKPQDLVAARNAISRVGFEQNGRGIILLQEVQRDAFATRSPARQSAEWSLLVPKV